MKKIQVSRTFQYADPEEEVVEYEKGTMHDVSDECAETAIEERWATVVE